MRATHCRYGCKGRGTPGVLASRADGRGQCACAGVKGLSTAHTSGRGKVVNTSIRPSLNHLDAEPCICAVIKSFREENAGQAFVYQVKTSSALVQGCLSKRAGLAGRLENFGVSFGREEERLTDGRGRAVCGGWQGKTWGATGTATPLTERRKEKINGWLAASHAPSAGRAGSASGRCDCGVVAALLGSLVRVVGCAHVWSFAGEAFFRFIFASTTHDTCRARCVCVCV